MKDNTRAMEISSMTPEPSLCQNGGPKLHQLGVVACSVSALAVQELFTRVFC